MKKTALIIVDYQYDFVDPNGKLYVPKAETKKAYILKLIDQFKQNDSLVITTQDQHPIDHYSFAQWGVHCVANTLGAQLYIPEALIDKKIIKGTKPNAESYSGFFDEHNQSNYLHEYLKLNRITDLVIVGVALEICVLATYNHAIELGYNAKIDLHGCAGFNN